MNLKTTVPLATAVVLGLVAAIVASQLVKQHPVALGGDGKPAVMNLSEVVVAARDIPPGTTLATGDLKVLRIDSATLPANTTNNAPSLFNRVAKVQIPAGQIVHESLLAEKGVQGGLPGVIAPGFRAMTIEINEFTGVAGMLEPGNHVDILARVAEAEGNGQMTRTIVQNVPIIAVGAQLTSKKDTGEVNGAAPVIGDQAGASQKVMARSITVLVTPEDAEKIDLASASNNARVVLRASTDAETAHVAGATLASLRGNQSHAQRDPNNSVQTASAKKGGKDADSVFGPAANSPFGGKTSQRTVTVIRAGIPTQVDVDEAASQDSTQDVTKDVSKDASTASVDFAPTTQPSTHEGQASAGE